MILAQVKIQVLVHQREAEAVGLDRAEHNEPAYRFDEIGFGWAASEQTEDDDLVTGFRALRRLLP